MTIMMKTLKGKLRGLDLFSGIGGLTVALCEWVTPVAYCERDRYAQGVLLSRMADNDIPTAPIWDDVTSLRGSMLPSIDIIYGGFPCQDISVAGTGKGLDGERSGLFRQIVRLAKEIKPFFLFLENVPAIRTRGLDRVIQELTKIGYDLRWTMLSAAEVGANHKRERWFLLAHTTGMQCDTRSEKSRIFQEMPRDKSKFDNAHGSSEDVANPKSAICPRTRAEQSRKQNRLASQNWWTVEPNVGRVAHGIPSRVDRLKCLGNAVVPLQAKTAFEILIGLRS